MMPPFFITSTVRLEHRKPGRIRCPASPAVFRGKLTLQGISPLSCAPGKYPGKHPAKTTAHPDCPRRFPSH